MKNKNALLEKFRDGAITYFIGGVMLIVLYLMVTFTSQPIAYHLGSYGKVIQTLVVLLPTLFILIGYILRKNDNFKISRVGSILFYSFSAILLQLSLSGGALGSTKYGARTIYFSWYDKLDATAKEACQYRSWVVTLCFALILLVCSIVSSIIKKNKVD